MACCMLEIYIAASLAIVALFAITGAPPPFQLSHRVCGLSPVQDAAGHGVRDAGGAGQRQRQAVERA